MDKLKKLNMMLAALAVFRGLKDDAGIEDLVDFLDEALEDREDRDEYYMIDSLSGFAGEIADAGDLGEYIYSIIKNDENPFLTKSVKAEDITSELKEMTERELDALTYISEFSPEDVRSAIAREGLIIPLWRPGSFDIKDRYMDMIESIPTKGYGMFSDYSAFKIDDGELIPVKHHDPQSINKLYGYEHERNQVLANTKALANGEHAANVLLYGDAGTGKSSTIKACANEYKDMGVRLIEFSKDQIPEIPGIIDKLYDSPLKFIFFIDDLSFSSEDDDFCYLKGILEGNVTGKSDNIAIYATSNRRHLVRELAEDRTGSDIHINDTLQQTMSLAARFGLTITFSKPGKDLYLDIVSHLAEEYGIKMDTEELVMRAERFAVRANGRSPRTARQFIESLPFTVD